MYSTYSAARSVLTLPRHIRAITSAPRRLSHVRRPGEQPRRPEPSSTSPGRDSMLSRSRSRSASAADAGVRATSSSGGSDLICGTVAPAPSWSPLAEHLIGCCAMVHRTGASTCPEEGCHAAGTRLSGCRSGVRPEINCVAAVGEGVRLPARAGNNFGADRAVGAHYDRERRLLPPLIEGGPSEPSCPRRPVPRG